VGFKVGAIDDGGVIELVEGFFKLSHQGGEDSWEGENGASGRTILQVCSGGGRGRRRTRVRWR